MAKHQSEKMERPTLQMKTDMSMLFPSGKISKQALRLNQRIWNKFLEMHIQETAPSQMKWKLSVIMKQLFNWKMGQSKDLCSIWRRNSIVMKNSLFKNTNSIARVSERRSLLLTQKFWGCWIQKRWIQNKLLLLQKILMIFKEIASQD